jgi:hypothetical protein
VTQEDLAALVTVVLADPALQRRLLPHTGRTDFEVAMTGLAGELGLDVTPDDIDRASSVARRSWREQPA